MGSRLEPEARVVDEILVVPDVFWNVAEVLAQGHEAEGVNVDTLLYLGIEFPVALRGPPLSLAARPSWSLGS